MRQILFYLLFLSPIGLLAQVVTTNPAFPVADQPVEITVDVTGTSLDNLAWDNTTNPVYIWTWINKPGSADSDAPTNVNPATAAQAAAKCTRISTNPDVYRITFTPTTFFNKTAAEIPRIGLKLKTKDWNENKQTDVDKFIDFGTGFNANFEQPVQSSFLKNNGEQFLIKANASVSSTFTLSINGIQVATQNNATSLSYTHTITETSGTIPVVCSVVSGADSKIISFTYTIRSATVDQARPLGIKDGINYDGDPTKATLSLWAPGKNSVYVIGDFTDWGIDAAYQLKQDGEHFWGVIDGLTAGEEYGFQYLVDEELYIADPYADKILDPDDQYIPESTYPNLKSFPTEALRNEWYFNRVSVLQTSQTPYTWQVTNFEKPAKEKLVVYELLIRDFFDANNRNYQNLIDTLSYFERLGINAIELMPIMEFNGNEGWGYNPAFMFAPDKYYGTKNKLKEFVDECHKRGIAVILDIALNHQDLPNPYALMYFDFAAGKPAIGNPWFNRDPKHPFNVFFDMNHESAYTKAYVDSINQYWLSEFNVDGFRFDLSKGFTQTNNPNDVGAWGAYDASRIALLKRMADKIWISDPDAYVILEHFAADSEEKELAEYRTAEGKGMMLWSNAHYAFTQNTQGYDGNTDISRILYSNRNMSVPHSLVYMESHDEERLMYDNLAFGNTLGGYSVKDKATALNRMKGANTILFSVPGPKMIWQFGELGYDQSINRCEDGSINGNCRLSPKPVLWNYQLEPERNSLFLHIADLLRLRNTYSVFTDGDATVPNTSSLVKQITIKNKPYTDSPVNENQMNVQIVVNFEVFNQNVPVEFLHTGTWYDYYAYGEELSVTTPNKTIALKPGEFKLYTDFPIANLITGVEDEITQNTRVHVYPNPTHDSFSIDTDDPILSVHLRSMNGQLISPEQIGENRWSIDALASGLYLVEVRTPKSVIRTKIIKD